MAKYRVVHYLNQFFANIGGEEKADIPPEAREGALGPGLALRGVLGEEYEIVATIICGDNYFGSNLEDAKTELLKLIGSYEPNLFVAGPAFNAGRYGVACGTMAKAVEEALDIPAVTGMYEENPGVDMFRKDLYIIKTGDSAAKMRQAMAAIGALCKKRMGGEEIGSPEAEGYHERGIRVNYWNDVRGSKRAVELLLTKMRGDAYTTEYPMPKFDRVTPCSPIKDPSTLKFAVVTSGGIVPQGNPDRIESSSATKFGIYSIEGMEQMDKEDFMTIHGGYDRAFVTEDPNLVIPLDVLREMEHEHKIGSLANYFVTTTGTGTSVGNSKRFGEEFAQKLLDDNIGAVILTST